MARSRSQTEVVWIVARPPRCLPTERLFEDPGPLDELTRGGGSQLQLPSRAQVEDRERALLPPPVAREVPRQFQT